jgi:hypothetical protein
MGRDGARPSLTKERERGGQPYHSSLMVIGTPACPA